MLFRIAPLRRLARSSATLRLFAVSASIALLTGCDFRMGLPWANPKDDSAAQRAAAANAARKGGAGAEEEKDYTGTNLGLRKATDKYRGYYVLKGIDAQTLYDHLAVVPYRIEPKAKPRTSTSAVAGTPNNSTSEKKTASTPSENDKTDAKSRSAGGDTTADSALNNKSGATSGAAPDATASAEKDGKPAPAPISTTTETENDRLPDDTTPSAEVEILVKRGRHLMCRRSRSADPKNADVFNIEYRCHVYFDLRKGTLFQLSAKIEEDKETPQLQQDFVGTEPNARARLKAQAASEPAPKSGDAADTSEPSTLGVLDLFGTDAQTLFTQMKETAVQAKVVPDPLLESKTAEGQVKAARDYACYSFPSDDKTPNPGPLTKAEPTATGSSGQTSEQKKIAAPSATPARLNYRCEFLIDYRVGAIVPQPKRAEETKI